MREVLYDVDWQLMRINALQERRDDGGWTTEIGTFNNLRTFEEYLDGADLRSRESDIRCYRVHNALNAVVMGYHGQAKNGADTSELIDQVRWFKDHHDTDKYSAANVRYEALSWDWFKQKQELEKLWKEDRDAFEFMRLNLKGRAKNGNKKTRPELYKFIDLMDLTAR